MRTNRVSEAALGVVNCGSGKESGTIRGAKTMEIAPELRQILLELRARFEVQYRERLVGLLLYGLQARGDADEGSDIDVLVVLERPVDPFAETDRTIEDVAGLSLEHDVVMACVFVSAERFTSEQSPLLMNVRAEGIPV